MWQKCGEGKRRTYVAVFYAFNSTSVETSLITLQSLDQLFCFCVCVFSSLRMESSSKGVGTLEDCKVRLAVLLWDYRYY